METAVRAHRILRAMANYKKASPADDWLLRLDDGRLGEPVGCYRNPGSDGEVIGIFSDGLAWHHGSRAIRVLFTEVSEVRLPSGKESEGLVLSMRDGNEFLLPVKGQRGTFFDSMEMLRFMDRVVRPDESNAVRRVD